MKNHPATLNVQLAASACVFNLTKQDLAAGMPVRLLSTVTQLLLEAMRTFPNHQQVVLHCSGATWTLGQSRPQQRMCESTREAGLSWFWSNVFRFSLFTAAKKLPAVSLQRSHPTRSPIQPVRASLAHLVLYDAAGLFYLVAKSAMKEG